MKRETSSISAWKSLTALAGQREIVVERVRLLGEDIAIEGQFSPPPLASLSADDQIFVTAFVRCHGSIKQMEEYFGISYPTVKNRLNRIGSQLEFVEIDTSPMVSEVLDQLERGEITAAQAEENLRK